MDNGQGTKSPGPPGSIRPDFFGDFLRAFAMCLLMVRLGAYIGIVAGTARAFYVFFSFGA